MNIISYNVWNLKSFIYIFIVYGTEGGSLSIDSITAS